MWIVLKLALGYVLIGYTHGIDSRYWPVLLLPVVTAATVLGFAGTLVFILLAAGAYSTIEEAQDAVCLPLRAVDPDPKAVAVYEQLYPHYRDLYFALGRRDAEPAALGRPSCGRRRKRYAARIAWRPWGSFPRASLTSCATPWERSRRRPRYWPVR